MISSTTGAGLVLPSYNPNGASTGPLEVGVFMEIVGLHRMSTAPEDAELYGRLQEWAWHHRRLSPLEQEAAFRLSRPELERRGVEEPNYWLRAAIRHAERFPFQSGDKEKAELNRILTIDELLAAPERPTPWAIYGFVARGEITTLAAPP
ncbi:MAG: hypothetical protein GTO05_06710, partial [Gemmatimonadales bacterium]|nr:hypothetical protein [Gemmatimonadales bacterium]